MTTLHVVGLPHTNTTREFDQCAYTAKVRKFSDMMMTGGYRIYLYGGEHNDARCTEHIPLLKDIDRQTLFPLDQVQSVDWNPDHPGWRLFNRRAITEISNRISPNDIICLISGWSHLSLIDHFNPSHLVCEFGVGYQGIAARYRAFESYAWMHTVYGHQQTAAAADGAFFDAVIPNYWDASEFPSGAGRGDYVAFLSRMIARKGVQVMVDLADRGHRFKVGGEAGDWKPDHPNIEYVGLLDAKGRAELLGNATVTLVPTLYVEPFGGVACESMLCGTPVVTTDWGAFTETVENGATGYRCRTLAEFEQAVGMAAHLDRHSVRTLAHDRWTFEKVGPLYGRWFDRLGLLLADGFYGADQ